MDIKKLMANARTLLAEMNTLAEAGDMDAFNAKKADYDALKVKIDAAKAVADANKDLDDVGVPDPNVEPQPQKAVRSPFDVDADNEPAEPTPEPDSFDKSFYVLKYGDLPSAQKAVLKDLYGGEYLESRANQMSAFVKYLRFGEHRLSLNEQKALKSIILRPEDLVEELQKSISVGEIKATLQESIADLGGYTVPEDFHAEIIKRLMGMTVVRGRARVVRTVRDSAEWPKLEGGDSQYTSAVRVTWVDEVPASATVAQTNSTWGMYRIPVHTVMARTDLSRNLVEDSAFNLLNVVAELFAEAMAIDEDIKFITGTGGGSPRGVLGNRSGAEETPETGIDAVNSGNATALTADGLIDLAYGLHTQYRGNAVFVGERLTHRDVRKLKDGNGDYLWERGVGMGEPTALLGYPFLESESLPTVGANKYPLIFGDFRGYMIVDRVGMTVERAEDTTTKGTNTVALFARRRLGGRVIEPWRFQVQKVSA